MFFQWKLFELCVAGGSNNLEVFKSNILNLERMSSKNKSLCGIVGTQQSLHTCQQCVWSQGDNMCIPSSIHDAFEDSLENVLCQKKRTKGHRWIEEGIDTPSPLCACPGVPQWASFPDDHFIWLCCTMLHCLHPLRGWHFIYCKLPSCFLNVVLKVKYLHSEDLLS